jgi:uncharacterized protein
MTTMPEPRLPQRFLDAAADGPGGRMPPVERWNPPYCGKIDMRIARDGRWFYLGTPITRMPLVRLFARLLRHDAGEHVLVTPVERVGITVEDAPFLAVEMAAAPDGGFAFRTHLDEAVIAGPEHPIRFAFDETGGLKPYIRIRGDLWARFTRALALEFAEHLQENAQGQIGFCSGGAFFAVPDAGQAPERDG